MKFLDKVAWADQEIELRADETSRKFLEFFTAWFTAAETLYGDVERDVAQPEKHGPEILMSDHQHRKRTLMQCVRQGLADVENDKGYLSMEWIGQMLLLAHNHWIHGAEMERWLTNLERRMMEQMTAIKLVELSEGAKL